MSQASDSRFILLEKRGYREREVYDSDNLEEMAEFLGEKTGGVDLSVDLPELEP